MFYFHNDYNECCHADILEKLAAIRDQQMPGYGMDTCCERAANLIREHCNNDSLSVHFLVGGTQTNLTVIAAALRPHQAVLCADTGHINVHETGAIEATGHKVVTLNSDNGKLTAEQIDEVISLQNADENAEHVVQIKMVYISNPTELGTIYSLEELEAISASCKRNGLYLFVDGARLGYALTAEDNNISLADLARLTDVFYIGGTKCGAMFGEAVVISCPLVAEDFRYLIKQRGGMLAKGWLLGVQFETLFEKNLYFEICKHANRMADQLRSTLVKLGYKQFVATSANQVFPVLPNRILEKLSGDFTFMVQNRMSDDHSAVRFCTSWATTQESIDALCDALERYTKA